MTTINTNKLLLEQVQDLLYRVTRWNGENHEVLTDLHDIKEAVKAVLAAPATAPAQPEKTVKEIMEFARHYAADTFSSATLEDKIRRSLAAPATAPDDRVKELKAERERCAKVCEAYAIDQHALYKGKPPYTGKEAQRYSPYIEGVSDGADWCADKIRGLG